MSFYILNLCHWKLIGFDKYYYTVEELMDNHWNIENSYKFHLLLPIIALYFHIIVFCYNKIRVFLYWEFRHFSLKFQNIQSVLQNLYIEHRQQNTASYQQYVYIYYCCFSVLSKVGKDAYTFNTGKWVIFLLINSTSFIVIILSF